MRSRFCTETHKIWLQVKMSVSDAVDVHITLMCYEIRHGTITATPSIEVFFLWYFHIVYKHYLTLQCRQYSSLNWIIPVILDGTLRYRHDSIRTICNEYLRIVGDSGTMLFVTEHLMISHSDRCALFPGPCIWDNITNFVVIHCFYYDIPSAQTVTPYSVIQAYFECD